MLIFSDNLILKSWLLRVVARSWRIVRSYITVLLNVISFTLPKWWRSLYRGHFPSVFLKSAHDLLWKPAIVLPWSRDTCLILVDEEAVEVSLISAQEGHYN